MKENNKKILRKLTLRDKINLLSGKSYWHTYDLTKKGLPPIMMCDGPHGLRKEIIADDELMPKDTVKATCFPPLVNLASTWDEKLVKEVGQAIAKEAKKEQVSIVLGPGINIKRSPLCGRNFEYFSEDPYLSGHLAKAFINGVQNEGIGTSLKHYALNNQETNRLHINAISDERTMREIYLKGFEIAIKESNPWTIMCSYNKINGYYASMNKYLLNDVLRDEWKYDGIVVTDWGAVSDRYIGLKYGLDLEMPTSKGYNNKIVLWKYLTFRARRKYLNQTARRLVNLIVKSRENLEPNYDFDITSNEEVALRACEDSFVLLKNDNNLLPLKKDDKICIIGEFAKRPRFQGEGSSHINAYNVYNAFDELKKAYQDVKYSKGYNLEKEEINEELINEAKELSKDVDKVLLFVGLPTSFESEGYDRKHLDLPPSHLRLIEEVKKVNSNVIVILTNGAPVTMSFVNDVGAIVEAYLGGQCVGKALANVLTGKTNFSGKLAETFPLTLESNPSFLNFPGEKGNVIYKEGIFVGYRYYESKNIPVLFPFGFGLSYTSYEYSELKINKKVIDINDSIKLKLKVKNIGNYDGKEIVQLYISPKNPSNKFSKIELRRYDKVSLNINEEKEIEFTLSSDDFTYFDEDEKRFVVNDDEYEILIGASIKDIRLKTSIKVNGEKILKLPRKLTLESTLYDLCYHPATREFTFKLLDPMAKSMIGKDTKYLFEHYDDDMISSMIMTKPLSGLPSLAQGKVKKWQLRLLLIIMNRKIRKYNRRLD